MNKDYAFVTIISEQAKDQLLKQAPYLKNEKTHHSSQFIYAPRP
jgi:hypothetical protein